MTIAQLQYFLAICDCGGITSAASKLFISQQALSKTVNTLERELDTALFLRTPSGIVLTKAGALLRDECRPIVEQFEQFSACIQHTIGRSSGTLRLCIFEDCFSFITVDEFNQFQARFPQYTLEIQEYQFQVCNQRLIEGKHDAALTIEPIHDRRIANIPLQSRQLVIVLRRDDPFAEQPAIAYSDLRQRKLVICLDRCGHQFTDRLFQEHGVAPEGIQRVSQLSNMFSICSENGYLGLTADYSAGKILSVYPNLTTKPLEGYPSPYTVTLAYHTNSEKLEVLNNFIQWVKEMVLGRNQLK